MFRMSFDQWQAKTVEELVLSVFMRTHVSCMHAQPVGLTYLINLHDIEWQKIKKQRREEEDDMG